jgi:hypothetical protein
MLPRAKQSKTLVKHLINHGQIINKVELIMVKLT